MLHAAEFLTLQKKPDGQIVEEMVIRKKLLRLVNVRPHQLNKVQPACTLTSVVQLQKEKLSTDNLNANSSRSKK